MSASRVKDVVLEHVARDIKQLQSLQSDTSSFVDMVSNGHHYAQALCEHLDRFLMHGLRESEGGYWMFVRYFTRSEVIHTLKTLTNVHMDIGKGRAWLYVALNEQALESYVRMFIDNQDVAKDYYLQESFIRDVERLIILQTLVAGLDFISFDLTVDCDYLDFAPTEPSSRLGISRGMELTPDIEPSFRASSLPAKRPTQQSSTKQPTKASSVKGPTKESSTELSAQQSSTELSAQQSSTELSVQQSLTVEKPSLTVKQPMEGSLGIEQTSKEALTASQEPVCPPVMSSFLERMYGESEESELVVRKQKKSRKKKKRSKATPGGDMVDGAPDPNQQNRGLPKDSVNVFQGSPKNPQRESPAAILEEDSPPTNIRLEATTTNTREESATTSTRIESATEESVATNIFEESATTITGEESPTANTGEESTPPDIKDSSGNTLEGFFTNTKEECSRKLIDSEVEADIVDSLQKEAEAQCASTSDKLSTGQINDCHSTIDKDTTETTSYSRSGPSPSENTDQLTNEVEDRVQDVLVASVTEETVETTPMNAPKEQMSPLMITETGKRAADVGIDENTRLVLSLDVLFEDSEELHRLVQVATPTGVGQQRNAYLLISDKAVYLLRKDGIEGIYSRELGIKFSQFEQIVIGLGWQSLCLVYYDHRSDGLSQSLGVGLVGGATERCVLLTGREAVSRGIVESVCVCAAQCPGFLRSIPLNRDDEMRLEAIEKELIKLGSHTSMEIVRYSLVNWEQVNGEPPPFVAKATKQRVGGISGWLLVKKSSSMLGLPLWKLAFFELKSGSLHQYAAEGDTVAKSVYTIRNCGGCTRVSGESKPFTISILDKSGTSLMLAAPNENDLARWLQALCEAVIGNETHRSPQRRRACLNCALLLTQNMLHILMEDWDNNSVALVTSCRVTDVNDISVDHSLPLYCTIAYDHGSSQGVWLICFNAEYELHKFESALCKTWEEEFQIGLSTSEIRDAALREKAHRAVELMQNSRHRSDSVTRGRSEFTYSATF